MPRKLTQEEAEQKSLEVDIPLVSTYITSHIKVSFKCKCERVFLCKPYTIWQRKTKSCGHCNDPEVGDKVGKLTISCVYPVKRGGCRVEAICECGKTWKGNYYPLASGNTKSCGHCNDPEVGDKVGKLTITKIIPNTRGGGHCRIEAICECGQSWKGKYYHFSSGNTKSCGHCDDPTVGDKFGRLTVLQVFPGISKGCLIQAVCECGELWSGPAGYLRGDHKTQSCGNCQLRCNGRCTSYANKRIVKILQNIGYRPDENTYIWKKGRLSINIDVVLQEEKIAIEYDEWYFHGYKPKQDRLRLRRIRRLGWKTLQIKAHNDLPTPEQLSTAINDLKNGSKQRTITLPSWGKGPTKFPIEQ